jgi:hypothetical protein
MELHIRHDLRLLSALFASSALIQLIGCASPTTVAASGSNAAIQNEAIEQQVLALTTGRDRLQRLQDLYWPLRRANTDLCGESIGLHSGFSFAQRADFGKIEQQVLTRAFGVTDQVTATHVTENAPAWKAGLRRGDQITAINGEAVGAGRNETRNLQRKFNDQVQGNAASYKLQISRNGTPQTLDITPEQVCSFEIILDPSDALNAYADGSRIYITSGMYRFVDTDQELQLVIAHELAHNSEGHINKKVGNSLVGSVFDIAAAVYGVNTGGFFGDIAGGMYSQEFETEADYVGLYMMARADIATVESANFWRRMAVESPGNIKGSYSASHPATSERWVAIDAAEREISGKQSAGQALLPAREE